MRSAQGIDLHRSVRLPKTGPGLSKDGEARTVRGIG